MGKSRKKRTTRSKNNTTSFKYLLLMIITILFLFAYHSNGGLTGNIAYDSFAKEVAFNSQLSGKAEFVYDGDAIDTSTYKAIVSYDDKTIELGNSDILFEQDFDEVSNKITITAIVDLEKANITADSSGEKTIKIALVNNDEIIDTIESSIIVLDEESSDDAEETAIDMDETTAEGASTDDVAEEQIINDTEINETPEVVEDIEEPVIEEIVQNATENITEEPIIELKPELTENITILVEKPAQNIEYTIAATSSPMNCTIREGACEVNETSVLTLSNFTNAHAQLPNESLTADYNYSICCWIEGYSMNISVNYTTDSGTRLLNLSNYTNAHGEEPNAPMPAADYIYAIYLNATGTNVQISSVDNMDCITAGHQTCIVTLSDHSNAHLASCGDGNYSHISICGDLNSSTPIVTLISPLDYASKNSDFNFTYNVTDPEGIGHVVNCSLDISYDGAAYIVYNLSTAVGATNNIQYTLSPGQSNKTDWKVNCTDATGESGVAGIWTVYIDNTIPEIYNLYSNDTDNYTRSDASLAFYVNVSEEYIYNVTLNGTLMSLFSGNTYSLVTTPAALGCAANSVCSLAAKATDNATNYNTTAYSLTLDDTLPISAIISPLNDSELDSSDLPFNITGNASDNMLLTNITLNISGTMINLNVAENWSYLWSPASDGDYVLRSTAYDMAGNIETAVEDIIIRIFTTSNVSNSTVENSSVANSTVEDSTITNSTITNSSEVTDSNVTDSILSNTTASNSSTITDSNVSDSIITNSTITNSSTVTESEITNSSIVDANISDSSVINDSFVNESSTIINTTITDASYITNSTIDDSNVTNSNITDSDVQDDSTIEDSTVNDSSTIINSDILNASTIINATIENSTILDSSTITDSSIAESNITNTTISDSSDITDSDITNSTIINSTVTNSTLINVNYTNVNISDSTDDGSNYGGGGVMIIDPSRTGFNTMAPPVGSYGLIRNSRVYYVTGMYNYTGLSPSENITIENAWINNTIIYPNCTIRNSVMQTFDIDGLPTASLSLAKYPMLDSTFINSIIGDANITNSSINNSQISGDSVLHNATITNSTIINCTNMIDVVISDSYCKDNAMILTPSVSLSSPANSSLVGTASVDFKWVVAQNRDPSNSAGTLYCNLTIDSIVNASNISSVNGTLITYTVNGLADGLHIWNITCMDGDKKNYSETREFTLDKTNPAISYTVNTAADNAVVNQTFIFVEVSITEANFVNLTFRLYNNSNLMASQTYSNSTRNHTFSNISDGLYTYDAITYDNVSRSNYTSVRTIVLHTAGSVTVNETQTEVIVNDTNTTTVTLPSNNSLDEIIITDDIPGTEIVLLNLTNMTDNSSGQSVTNFTSDLLITRELSSGNVSLEIYENTSMITDGSWQGMLGVMRERSTSEFTAPNSGTVNMVIEVGLTADEFNLTDPARITFTGKAGKRAAWSNGSAQLIDIATVCDNAINPTNIDNTTTRECYISSGNDLLVWTYHLTVYAAYTPPVTPTTTTSSSSRRPSTSTFSYVLCSTNWTCGEWSACTDSMQTRTCTKINESCNATAEKPIETQTCVMPSVPEKEEIVSPVKEVVAPSLKKILGVPLTSEGLRYARYVLYVIGAFTSLYIIINLLSLLILPGTIILDKRIRNVYRLIELGKLKTASREYERIRHMYENSSTLTQEREYPKINQLCKDLRKVVKKALTEPKNHTRKR